MLPKFWDPNGYPFWLLMVSVVVFSLERLRPWRKSQRVQRPQLLQDFFWLIFNGHFAGVLVALVASRALAWAAPGFASLESLRFLSSQPLWLQFLIFFTLKDFLEWGVHNLLHRVSWLWEFHKLHHTIEELDWIGHFRFHWMEIVVYRAMTYAPLAVMGADMQVVLLIAVVATLIGHLNHSNLKVSWGPLRYVFNSPRMHLWHHARQLPADRPKGANFGISLSIWDWLFGTAWWPDAMERPEGEAVELGFPDMDQYPRGLLGRLAYPFTRLPFLRRSR
jgi:sterol desaturase/sphingolipid hydroxylase (fatty acid hydroxylase superfamily)